MENKMTYVLALANAIEVTDGETREKLEQLKASLEKKSANRKPASESDESKALKSVIREVLTTLETPKTVSEIQALSPILAPLSNQRMSALLRSMTENGEAVKTKSEKGNKTLYALA